METQINGNQLLCDLSEFMGTEQYHNYSLYGQLRNFQYSDGIKYLIDKTDCYWFLDIIASFQPFLQSVPFQTWELTVNEDKRAVVAVHDGNENYLKKKNIPYTDFPVHNRTITLYLTNGILLLPNED